MDAILIAAGVFLCVFGAGVIGLRFQVVADRADTDSREVVRLVQGLVSTLTALVLSLLIASAQSNYRAQVDEVNRLASNVVLLDRLLENIGPSTRPMRNALREGMEQALQHFSPTNPLAVSASRRAAALTDGFYGAMIAIRPENDVQRAAFARAATLALDIAQTRLIMSHQMLDTAMPFAFVAVVTTWLALLFFGFGLFARRNATVLMAIVVGAFAASGAVFLILELDQPYSGLLRLSDEPVRLAIERMRP